MHVTRRAPRLAPLQIRFLLAAATLIGAGAVCLAALVAYGWGMTAGETTAQHGQNGIFTALILALIGFVLWLWRQLAVAREETLHHRKFFK